MDFIERNIRLNNQLTFLFKYIFPPFWMLLIVFISPMINGTAIFYPLLAVLFRLWIAIFFAFPYWYVFSNHFQKTNGIYAVEYINDEKAAAFSKIISQMISFFATYLLLLYFLTDRIGICLFLAIFHTILISLPMMIGMPDPYWEK